MTGKMVRSLQHRDCQRWQELDLKTAARLRNNQDVDGTLQISGSVQFPSPSKIIDFLLTGASTWYATPLLPALLVSRQIDGTSQAIVRGIKTSRKNQVHKIET